MLKRIVNMKKCNLALRLLLVAVLVVSSSQLFAQDQLRNKANLSVDLVVSGGVSTMINNKGNNNAEYSWYGVFKNKETRFTQLGFDLRKKLRRNTLKTGIHLGTWSYSIEGQKYMSTLGLIINRELSPEMIKEKFQFHRLSIPVSYVIEAKNVQGLKVEHELGLFADLYFNNNVAEVRYALNGWEGFQPNRINPFSPSLNSSIDVGMRIFYGISIAVNDKIALGSSFTIGGFAIGRYRNYDFPIDSAIDYHVYSQYAYRMFEFGLNARYSLF